MPPLKWSVAEGRWADNARNCLEDRVAAIAWPEDGRPPSEEMLPFAAAKMLHEGAAPEGVRRALAAFPLPCGLPLTDAMAMPWEEVLFPLCTERGGPGAGYLELGLLPAAAADDALDGRLPPDAAAAITRALRHARRKTNRRYACWLRNAGSQAFSGPSLALPVYLAALWLGRGSLPAGMGAGDPSSLLATGDIDDAGGLRQVGGIKEKSLLLNEEEYPQFAFSGFLFPAGEGDEAGPGEGKFYPVSSPEDAAAIAAFRIRNPSFWQDILRLQKDYAHFWDVLGHDLTDAEAEFLWRQAIRLELIDPSKALDVTRLKQLADFIDLRRQLAAEASEILTPQWARLQPVSAAAYKLCRIFQTNAGQRGSPDAEDWAASAKKHLPAAEERNGSAETMVHKARCLCDRLHNRYIFGPGDENIASLAEDAREAAPFAKMAGKAFRTGLGETYGFLCQHYAFCGDGRQALEYAGLAMDIFSAGCGEDAANHKKRILCYKAYALWDCGKNAEAARTVRERAALEGTSKEDPYTLSLEARAAFEAGSAEEKLISRARAILEDFQAYRRLPLSRQNGKTAGGRLFNHPWQLFFWNMGRLPEQGQDREHCLRMACAICCPWEDGPVQAQSGPSTGAPSGWKAGPLVPMALLPLSRLVPDAETLGKTHAVLSCMRAMAEAGKISPAHFAEVLGAAGPAAALEAVRRRLPKLFPFNYR